jgi:hypothetical protein
MSEGAGTFEKKAKEFVQDLMETFPELVKELDPLVKMPTKELLEEYMESVFMKHMDKKDNLLCPGTILPGVTITPALWATVSEATKRSVYDYLSILDLLAMCENGSSQGMGKEWAENIMKNWRSRMDKVDFELMAEKFKDIFGGTGALPKLPEKFLKGKLAKLAEDIVREFKPEDFGLRPEDMKAVERDPARAFEILMQASTANPSILQNAMLRVGKRLQTKIQRGELRPEELAAEAEEMMKEFQSNPAFTEMMESFRKAFSFEDPVAARAAGRDDKSRLAQTQARLRKKLEERKAAAAKAAAAKK